MKYLILENIRSAYNVGAIFRTADGAGVAKIFLVGYTPTPIDRFGRPQTEILKTSLGASKSMPWQRVDTVSDIINQLKTEGVRVVAVEQVPEAQSISSFAVPQAVAYVVGNEIDGVSKEVLKLSDEVIEIPMLGTKESLNVAVATGIILYLGV